MIESYLLKNIAGYIDGQWVDKADSGETTEVFNPANGKTLAEIPYMAAERLGYGVGVLSSPSYDYGNTYLWVAGLLNYLIVLDAFDVARGRKP